MGVRLNKVLTELNIGLQTAVDYLKNKKSLGEIKDDANVNTKITDEQYEALVKEFKGDKDVKKQANMIFPKKEKKDKPKPKETVKIETKDDSRQAFTPLGKIDLDSLNGKKPAAKPAVEPAKEEKAAPKAAAESPVKKEVSKEEVKVADVKPEPKVEEKAEPKAEPVVEVKSETPETPQLEEEAEKAPEVYKLKTEQKAVPNLNVVGKIDLDSLNQSTRPKKKTKEERRKEREEKQAQLHGGNGEKKKRERIRGGKERVDIEAAASQDNGNGKNGKQKKNKGGNQNFQDNGGGQQQGGKKNKKNRPVRTLEVDDEAVARQVKETLARLTSKNQNKKGAKYRREKRDAVAERMQEEMETQAAESKVLKLTEFVTVSELATMMNVGVNQVIGTCMSIGIMVSINQRLDAETINIVAEEFGFTTEYVSAEYQRHC